MKHWDKIIAALFVILGIGMGTHKNFGGITPITLTAPAHVSWQKPTTDAQWAEDVKAEQIDRRSDSVLTQMLTSQTEKLAKEQKELPKYVQCADCIYWDYYKQFLDGGMDDLTAQKEAHTAADTAINQHTWEVEKIQQSIERIQHEQDLRAKGFVLTDEKPLDAPLFGGTTKKPIRHIID